MMNITENSHFLFTTGSIMLKKFLSIPSTKDSCHTAEFLYYEFYRLKWHSFRPKSTGCLPGEKIIYDGQLDHWVFMITHWKKRGWNQNYSKIATSIILENSHSIQDNIFNQKSYQYKHNTRQYAKSSMNWPSPDQFQKQDQKMN